MRHTILAAFDFDHTICDDNTDVVVRKLLSEEKIPEDVKSLYKSSGWIAYMGRIFELLHENNVDAQQIENAVANIPAVAGIATVLTSLRASNHDVVIISDSNSLFIDCWLKSKKLERVVSRVFTNPAWYDGNGMLRVSMYHTQRSCQLSAVNLCKGQVLTDYVKERRDQGVNFDRIIYVGDGRNDLCPILRLSRDDLACPRQDYALIDILDKLPPDRKMKAQVVPWENGRDLRCSLERVVGSDVLYGAC
ncbi:hypothetical protein DMN91_008645 [Ooceraea biroi]|uniref:Pyridoxal phosphate phosphatase PHOSPHO2 n=1 Tax=Ooceraea biroi TaxID=2015173 RepID=A0A026X2Q5_OOCBI|nr:pyridoxal phosphate phosphatase PHOSPHO2 [Ooceraea biroi]EZA61649.1 Pyridoxal phosphate phosphatase PHOSPHO2 [Ooceraea biroi]RLU18289.1 hypothetical protein DMN91_008645 [Ooceraea biroi]